MEASILQFWRDYADRVPAGQHRPETPARAFVFGDSKELADELASLVRQGIKTATCSALWSYEEEQRPVPQKGEYSVVLDGNGVPVAVIETVEVFVAPFTNRCRWFVNDSALCIARVFDSGLLGQAAAILLFKIDHGCSNKRAKLESLRVAWQLDRYRAPTSLQFGWTTLLVTVLSCTGHLCAETIPEIVARAKPAIVQLITLDQNRQPLRTGTGFFVSGDGYLLTNNHVVEGGSYVTARTSSGAAYPFEAIVVRSTDPDIAELKFTTTDVPHLQLGSSADTVEGQKVLVIGNPEGLQGTVSDGIISAFRDDRTYIQITAPISPGSSGSPVLDESGQVIGMATLVFREGQNLNFAISSERIKHFLLYEINQPQVQATPSPTPVATSPQTEDAAQDSVLLTVNRAIDTHDWKTLTGMTVDGLVNYFGHKHVTNAYIAQDMENDSRNYVWIHSTIFPNTFTHEVSDQYSSHWKGPMIYDSMNIYSEALEKNGKLHKATTRLTVGYVLDSSGHPAIYSLTLKVL